MRVSAEYAASHLSELLAQAEGPESVEIERQDRGVVRLALIQPAAVHSRNSLWGAMKGQILIAEDFDSPEVNKEIEASFYESE